MALMRAEKWFWVWNATADDYGVEIHRIAAWEKREEGYVGLISNKDGTYLIEPPPVPGIYKHIDDLTPNEKAALDLHRVDPELNAEIKRHNEKTA